MRVGTPVTTADGHGSTSQKVSSLFHRPATALSLTAAAVEQKTVKPRGRPRKYPSSYLRRSPPRRPMSLAILPWPPYPVALLQPRAHQLSLIQKNQAADQQARSRSMNEAGAQRNSVFLAKVAAKATVTSNRPSVVNDENVLLDVGQYGS